MKTAPGVRETTFEAAAGDKIALNVDFASLVGQHGAIVVAECVIAAEADFTLHSSTWSVGNTYLTLVLTAPSTPATGKLAVTMAIKFTNNAELLNFEAYVDLS